MRDNTKGGALTEVTFYILLSLFTPRHGYAVMQFIEETTGGQGDCRKRIEKATGLDADGSKDNGRDL